MRRIKKWGGVVVLAALMIVSPGASRPAYAGTFTCAASATFMAASIAGMFAAAFYPPTSVWGVSALVGNLWFGVPWNAYGVATNCK